MRVKDSPRASRVYNVSTIQPTQFLHSLLVQCIIQFFFCQSALYRNKLWCLGYPRNALRAVLGLNGRRYLQSTMVNLCSQFFRTFKLSWYDFVGQQRKVIKIASFYLKRTVLWGFNNNIYEDRDKPAQVLLQLGPISEPSTLVKLPIALGLSKRVIPKPLWLHDVNQGRSVLYLQKL